MKTRTPHRSLATAALAACLGLGLIFTSASLHAQPAPLEGAIKTMANVPDLREGDLLFIQSRTDNATGITLLTGSTITHCGLIFKEGGKWVVYEGAGIHSDEHDSLADWWKKELHGHADGDTSIYIRRLTNAADALAGTKLAALKEEAAKLHNTAYDNGFQWKNFNPSAPAEEYVYCSELLYKAYQRATGVEIGAPHPVKDYLGTPAGQKVLEKLIAKTPKKYFASGKFDENDLIISPVDVMKSDKLTVVQPKP